MWCAGEEAVEAAEMLAEGGEVRDACDNSAAEALGVFRIDSGIDTEAVDNNREGC